MNALIRPSRIHPVAWILLVALLTLLAGLDATRPSGWEKAASHIRDLGETTDLILLTPAWEARQVAHFEGSMAVAANGVLPREVGPWTRIWLISQGDTPPGITPLLRAFEPGVEHGHEGITWRLYTRKESPR